MEKEQNNTQNTGKCAFISATFVKKIITLLSIIFVLDGCDVIAPPSKIEGEVVYERILSDRNAGSPFMLHAIEDQAHILPTRTPLRSDEVVKVTGISDRQSTADSGVSVPEGAALVCALQGRTLYKIRHSFLDIDLRAGAAAAKTRVPDIFLACTAEQALSDTGRCNAGTVEFRRMVSPSGTVLTGCVSPDGLVLDFSSRSGDGQAVWQFNDVTTPAQRWAVRSLNAEELIVQGRYPTRELFGVLAPGGRVRFGELPEGPWYEDKRGFGGGRVDLRIIRAAVPFVVLTSSGTLFVGHEKSPQKRDEVAAATLKHGDECELLFLTDHRTGDQDSDGLPLRKQTIYQTRIC